MNHAALRIVDASLNRTAEGLRVVEDYARFVLNDRFLSEQAKQTRHHLAESARQGLPSAGLTAMRDTQRDVGTAITTPAENSRADAWQVCAASLKRVEQALRSLEEYGKLIDTGFAAACEQLRYRVYTLEKALDTSRHSIDALVDKRLYVLVDGRGSVDSFTAIVRELVDAGVDAIQLRDKQLSGQDLMQRARALVAETRAAHVLAIVNDRADIAVAANADGVHLGQEDLSVANARLMIGPAKLIGVSTHEIAHARQAVLDGADYLGAGPTFPSRTKTFDEFPGLGYLREVAAEVSLPTFAIGGIHAENLPQVLETGVTRIAVSGAVTGSSNPATIVRKLRELLTSKPPTPVGG